ncbi:unnamed protein product, partial [Polarella glacialis]
MAASTREADPPGVTAASADGGVKSLRDKMQEKTARLRNCLKQDQDRKKNEEDATTERWTGLRITDRCVRQEKWDASVRGKERVLLSRLSLLSQQGTDQVVVGVLCSPPAMPKMNHRSELCAEWTLTDLDKERPCEATVVLVGRAVEHWASQDGPGRPHAKVGSIIAVLNPKATGKSSAMLASMETQVIKLGMCPSLGFCSVLIHTGRCGAACHSEGSGYCERHSNQSHWARQAELSDPRSAARKRKPGCEASTSTPATSPWLGRLPSATSASSSSQPVK